ncbi:MAG: site-2 protease family protein [Gemmatimonadota bacterium]|nr:site-2 protease family protein [Gemmatimonadota bacterium]
MSWESALKLLPVDSKQYDAITSRITDLNARLESASPRASKAKPGNPDHPAWRRALGGIATAFLLLLGKLKFLLLGLTKASTFFSMFAFFGVYWSIFGWPLALGLVISIYIHEMGHVFVLRKLGIGAGAPLFIPGVGALVMLKEHPSDAHIDAKIGLAGPIWGLGAGLAAMGVFVATRIPIWAAIAHLTAFINLFNLTPVWQLDGSRGFHALNRQQRVAVIGVVTIAYLLTNQKMLAIVGIVAVWRAVQKEQGPGDTKAFGTYVLLIAALSWLARAVA